MRPAGDRRGDEVSKRLVRSEAADIRVAAVLAHDESCGRIDSGPAAAQRSLIPREGVGAEGGTFGGHDRIVVAVGALTRLAFRGDHFTAVAAKPPSRDRSVGHSQSHCAKRPFGAMLQ